MKKALFIGGTGTISAAITRSLLADGKWEVFLLNRGNRQDFEGAKQLICDANDEAKLKEVVGNLEFDVVADFVAFEQKQVERDYRVFAGKTKQYIFISSASAYQKFPSSYIITESTPLYNPFWRYSRNKIACEDFLNAKYRESGFPITIVRPSHTYDERSVPVGLHGNNGSWQVIKRIKEGKPVIIHGDGTSLWTLTHNTDFAKGFIGLMGNVHAIGEAFQITSDESVTWRQIHKIIADYFNQDLAKIERHMSSQFLHAAANGKYDFRGGLTGDKANSVVFDNTKLKRLVPDFCATIRADQGLISTLENVLKMPALQKEDPDFDAWCDKVVNAYDSAIKSLTY